MSEMTIRTTRTGMNTSTTATPFTGLGLGEAPATTSALRSQTGRVEALAEQVQLLHGIITVDDAIDLVLPLAWKKRLPRIFH